MLIMFSAPLPASKLEEWRQFTDEMLGPRRDDYERSRQHAGITKERALLQPGADGNTIIYTMTCLGGVDAAPNIFRDLATSPKPFTVWYRRRMLELLGVDFSALAGPQAPELACIAAKKLPPRAAAAPAAHGPLRWRFRP